MFSSLFNLLRHMRNFLDREALFYLWSNSWKIFKVVYMDEPSTGLDPASRNNLWNVVKRAKQDRAIILTSKHTLSLSFSLYVIVELNHQKLITVVLLVLYVIVEFESPETHNCSVIDRSNLLYMTFFRRHLVLLNLPILHVKFCTFSYERTA